MAWVAPSQKTTGEFITAADWNQDIDDNIDSLRVESVELVFTMDQAINLSGASSSTRHDHPIILFNDAATESADFVQWTSPAWSGSVNSRVDVWWMAASITNNVVWRLESQRFTPLADDIDSVTFTNQVDTTDTAPGTPGFLSHFEVNYFAFQADEPFRLRVSRLGGDGSDTMSGDAELYKLRIRQYWS